MKISNSKKELARIISENGGWSDGAEFAAQDKDGDVFKFDSKPVMGVSREVWMPTGNGRTDKLCYCTTIKGWHQTILSREEYFHLYQAPDADGWIEWNGGECPVSDDSIIDVKFKSGHVGVGLSPLPGGGAGRERWRLINGSHDVIAYRPNNPEQSKPEFCESVMRSIPEPDGQVWTNPPTIEQLAADYRAKLAIATQAQEEADSHRCGAEVALSKLEIAAEDLGFKIEPITTKQDGL